MINISKKDIDKFERIASGRFGTVYRVDDDYAYKIYHKSLYDFITDTTASNPCLTRNGIRLRRLYNKRDKIINTDLFEDYVFIDGRFGGIKIPYYDGKVLFRMINESFELKYNISKQLVINSKELTDNNIYPQDYKLNNIIYYNDEVKIIDLDDVLTKVTLVSNAFYRNKSIRGINDTIRSYFNESEFRPYDDNVRDKLLKSFGKKTTNYDDINKYLENKNKNRDFIIIDSNSDLDILKETGILNDHHIIYLFNTRRYDNDYYMNILLDLESKGIKIYDLLCFYDKDKYFNNTRFNEIIRLKEKQFIKIK